VGLLITVQRRWRTPWSQAASLSSASRQ
jgi:hypothetical protein